MSICILGFFCFTIRLMIQFLLPMVISVADEGMSTLLTAICGSLEEEVAFVEVCGSGM